MNNLTLDFAKLKAYMAYGGMAYGQAIEKILENTSFDKDLDREIYRSKLIKKFIGSK